MYFIMVPSIGFEPTTWCLQGNCSASWAKTACRLVGVIGVGPMTSSVWRKRSPAELNTQKQTSPRTLSSRGFLSTWWALMDLNHRPPAYQADALTSWAKGPWASTNIQLLFFPDKQNRIEQIENHVSLKKKRIFEKNRFKKPQNSTESIDFL